MRGFFYSVFTLFLSRWGIVVLGALDSSMVFFLPLAIDSAVVFLAARDPDFFWLYPVLASLGSVGGAAATFWIGRRLGEPGFASLTSAKRLERIKRRVKRRGAVAMALPALIPPPFPFTPFILACGALDVDRVRFFGTLASMRLLRFGVESLLALVYGERIVRFIASDTFRTVILVFAGVAIAGSAWSAYRLGRSTRQTRRRA